MILLYYCINILLLAMTMLSADASCRSFPTACVFGSPLPPTRLAVQGIGCLSEADRLGLVAEELGALAQLLDDQAFVFGDRCASGEETRGACQAVGATLGYRSQSLHLPGHLCVAVPMLWMPLSLGCSTKWLPGRLTLSCPTWWPLTPTWCEAWCVDASCCSCRVWPLCCSACLTCGVPFASLLPLDRAHGACNFSPHLFSTGGLSGAHQIPLLWGRLPAGCGLGGWRQRRQERSCHAGKQGQRRGGGGG